MELLTEYILSLKNLHLSSFALIALKLLNGCGSRRLILIIDQVQQLHLLITILTFCSGDETFQWRARLGTSVSGSGGSLQTLKSIVPHPEFDRYKNDVAVIILNNVVTLTTKIGLARLAGASYILPAGSTITALGYGSEVVSFILPSSVFMYPIFFFNNFSSFYKINVIKVWYHFYSPIHLIPLQEGVEESAELKKVDVSIVDQQTCFAIYDAVQEEFPYWPTIDAGMVCTGVSADGGSACYGDNGAPVVTDGDVLYAMSSWGKNCADEEHPIVNTLVPRYTDWIISVAEGSA